MLTTVLGSARKTAKKLPSVALVALTLVSGLSFQAAKAAEDFDTQLGTVQAFSEGNAKFSWEPAVLKFPGSDRVYNFGGKSKLVLSVPKGGRAGFMLTDLPKNPAGQTNLIGELTIYMKASQTKPAGDVTVRVWVAPDLSHPDECKVVDIKPDWNSQTQDEHGTVWKPKVYKMGIEHQVPGICNIKKATVFVDASADREIVVNGVDFDYEYPGMNRWTRPGNVVLTNAGPLAFKSPSDKNK